MRLEFLATLLVPAFLVGCATAPRMSSVPEPTPVVANVPPHRTLPLPRVGIEVRQGERVISSGEAVWLGPHLAVSSLSAVNDVPPTGEIVAFVAGKAYPASMWVGGNFEDSDAALLRIHHPDEVGPTDVKVTFCKDLPNTVMVGAERFKLHSDLSQPLAPSPEASPNGAGAFGTNCLAGVISSGPKKDQPIHLTPASVIERLQSVLPKSQ